MIAVDVPDDGKIRIVEAERRWRPADPERADTLLTGWHYPVASRLRSRGRVQASPAAAPAGLRYVGVPYSFLGYLAVAAHVLHPGAAS